MLGGAPELRKRALLCVEPVTLPVSLGTSWQDQILGMWRASKFLLPVAASKVKKKRKDRQACCISGLNELSCDRLTAVTAWRQPQWLHKLGCNLDLGLSFSLTRQQGF